MLTADQHARLPGILRDIVDHDRHTAAIVRAIPIARVIDIGLGAEAARVAAANAILDRGYGKPSQPVDGDGEGGAVPVGLTVQFIRPTPDGG